MWVKRIMYNDGGRVAAGFKPGAVEDCVVRAFSIVTGLGYMRVYLDLCKIIDKERGCNRSKIEGGIYERTCRKYINQLTGKSKCKINRVRKWQDIPLEGKYFVLTQSHAVAYIDGVIHDMFDPVGDEEVGDLEGYYTL
jgi:hypothetical protein